MVSRRSKLKHEAKPKVKRVRKESNSLQKPAFKSMINKYEAAPLGTAILTFYPGPDMLALVFSFYGYADEVVDLL